MADETPGSGEGTGSEGTVDVTVETAGIVTEDGVEAVVMRTTAAIDVDGDGIVDAVDVIEAIGIDANHDGEISEDEVTVSETVYVRDDLIEGGDADPDAGS